MTNFKFFCNHSLVWLYKPVLPTIVIIQDGKDDDDLKHYPDAWGYYKAETNEIIIIERFDCLALRIHEYGHWFTERLRRFLDAIWEFPWWGLGLRSLLGRKGRP